MWPYLFLACYTAFLWLINYRGYLGRKTFLILAFFPACILLALRGSGVGEDTYMYLQMAAVADGMSWGQLSHVGSSIIWNMNQYGYGSSVNVGYLIICKAVMSVFDSNEAVQIFCAVVTCGLIGRFIYKNVDNVALAYWVFLCGGLFMFSFNGMRQMLALAIGAQAYEPLREKRFYSVAVWVILASLIHTSALVFVGLFAVYLIAKNRKILKPMLLACLLLPVSIPLLETITSLISSQYASYFSNNYWHASVGGIVLIWAIVLGSLFAILRKKKSQEGRFVALMAAFYLSLSVASLGVSIFERVALYPQVFLLLLFPLALESINKKNRWWYSAIVICSLFLLYLSYSTDPTRIYALFI